MNEVCLLRTENLNKTFFQGSKELVILDSINMTVKEGEILAITGASGVGKSTLLHILGALDKPSSGKIYVKDEDVFQRNATGLAAFRNRFVGFVFQFHHLLAEFTALENVMMPLLINRMSIKEAKIRATNILVEVGLQERLTHRPAKLSGGEQQRIAVARALVNEPLLLLADEPTGNLDEKTAAMMLNLFKQLNEKLKTTMVIVTHNEELAQNSSRHYKIREQNIHLM